METLVNSGISLSPVLPAAPQEQMSEAALAFASRRRVGLGKTRTTFPVEIALEVKGTLASVSQCTHTSHSAHLSVEEMDRDTNNYFFQFAKTF